MIKLQVSVEQLMELLVELMGLELMELMGPEN